MLPIPYSVLPAVLRRASRRFWAFFWGCDPYEPDGGLTTDETHAVFMALPLRWRIRAIWASFAQPFARGSMHTEPMKVPCSRTDTDADTM